MLKQSIGIKTFSRIPDLGTGIQVISHIAIASHITVNTAIPASRKPPTTPKKHDILPLFLFRGQKLRSLKDIPLRSTSILIKKLLNLKIRQKMIVSAIWLLGSSRSNFLSREPHSQPER
jgi:hypothetical protein